LREVGLLADTLPSLSQRSAEFFPPTERWRLGKKIMHPAL
jgi:hypothetical protein